MAELALSLNKRQSTIFYKGFGIIEAVVGIALAAMLLTAFMTLTMQTIEINRANINELKASMYLKELIEIAKDLEQSDWNELASSNCPTDNDPLTLVCYPSYGTSSNWILNEGEKQQLENGAYFRWLTIDKVCRDEQNQIKSTCDIGDVPSASTTKVTAQIFWKISWYGELKNRELKLETYIYNY